MVQSDLNSDDSRQPNLERVGRVDNHENLLSPERKQKLELLSSLLNTQQQSLIVCGPVGIGKTTTLKQLAKSKSTRQLWSYVECDGSLTFRKLVTHLSSVLSLGKERSSKNSTSKVAQKLANQLSKIAKNDHIVVLVLDDIGHLQAGIITKFMAFSRQCQGLQLILSITPDHLFVKRYTDYVIDDGYVVEIPPLTKQESADFTLNFLEKNKHRFESVSLSENLTAEIYQTSQGIPGVIQQEIVKMEPESVSLSGKYKINSLLWLGLIGLIIWGGFSYLNRLDNTLKNVSYVDLNNSSPALVEIDKSTKPLPTLNPAKDDSKLPTNSVNDNTSYKTTESSANSVFPPTSEDILNSTLESDVASLSGNALNSGSTDDAKNNVRTDFKNPTLKPKKINKNTNKTQAVSSEDQKKELLAINQKLKHERVIGGQSTNRQQTSKTQNTQKSFHGINGPDWILLQDRDSYTLQLMASSEKELLSQYVDKSTELHDQSAYYKMKLKGKNWYGLIYGVYPTIAVAKQAIKRLPKSVGKPYMLPINEVHSRIKEYQ